MRCIILILIAALLGQGQLAVAGEAQAVRLRWADLGGLVNGKTVWVSTTDGSTHKGRVLAVEAEGISLEGGKTARIARASVAEIRLIDYVGNGRYIGKMVGGAVGLTAGLLGMVAVGMKEDFEHKDRNKALAAGFAVSGLPLGLLGGYYLGKRADREVTVIRIIPE